MIGTILFHYLKSELPDFTPTSFKMLVNRKFIPELERLYAKFVREGIIEGFKLDNYEFVFV